MSITPVWRQAQVWIKSGHALTGGSIQDRIALAMIEAAEARGLLSQADHRRPTSGNTGVRAGHGGAVRGTAHPGDARTACPSSAAA